MAKRAGPTPPDGPDCTCGGTIPRGRRDGFCSSWCAGRDAQGLDPQAPPPRFTSATPPPEPEPAAVAPSSLDDASRADPGDSSSTPAAPAAAADPSEPTRPPYRQRRRKIADEVEARLRQADMLGSWQAAQVLDLADALDWQVGSLSARATAHRELERQMSELLRGQDEPGSSVGAMRDEVAERRARRQQRAGGAV